MHLETWGWLAALSALAACHGPPRRARDETSLPVQRSPGGTPEIDPEAAWAARDVARFIDVRELHELGAPLGHVPGTRWIPLRELARASSELDPRVPFVLLCRSGRRSGAAARYLADLGFLHVASVTGGMLAWRQASLPTIDHIEPDWDPEPPPPSIARLTREDLSIHLGDERSVRWTKAASLLLHGHESCVDGRDAHAVLGTPGGDAGELLLALSAAELARKAPFSDAEVERLFRAYLDAFGHFYLHTDHHALDALGARLEQDPRFSEVALAPPGRVAAVEALVRQAPPALEDSLLEHLSAPETIGCGHLRLALENPQTYGVRPGLHRALLESFYRRLWRGELSLELAVLEGEHREAAVLLVDIEGDLEAFTPVPMVAPRVGKSQMFVAHPRVAQFVRHQNVAFLRSQGILSGLDGAAFEVELGRLAERQLEATLARLAAELPMFSARFRGRTLVALDELPNR